MLEGNHRMIFKAAGLERRAVELLIPIAPAAE
jgi:hypothetical protein